MSWDSIFGTQTHGWSLSEVSWDSVSGRQTHGCGCREKGLCLGEGGALGLSEGWGMSEVKSSRGSGAFPKSHGRLSGILTTAVTAGVGRGEGWLGRCRGT